MKRFCVLLMACSMVACTGNWIEPDIFSDVDPDEVPSVSDPIKISSPAPAVYIDKVTLTDQQKGYVAASNVFAFKSLAELAKTNKGSMVYSPLSLQVALAMTVNGASGETAKEITNALGFGTDIDALNEYCNTLLNQLPAVDKDVDISLANAMLVKKGFPVQNDFLSTLGKDYYAPVEYFEPKSTQDVADRINEWAYRNTKGFIYPFLDKSDIGPLFVAAIMNALYFKAKWWGNEYHPMFKEDATEKNQPFYLDGGGKTSVDLMRTANYIPYAKRNGYCAVAIPYANEKYAMYVLLPDEKGKQGVSNLIKKLQSERWEDLISTMGWEIVNLSLPKFEIENKYNLNDAMNALGIKRAFKSGQAQFDRMFDVTGWDFWIDSIIQKARISVTEWGTEAAAVTAVMIAGASGISPRPVDFVADHPFVYVIAERTSGTILFEGVFKGK